MQLTAIKLAGFKSFVDPTYLQLTSNLTGIVGPNGCGKSNVIDAVRWVTGESSAKQLRGAALEDVIFNGSKARKPVGRASVELLFDNSDGKLGGQYAEYAEISIRRRLSRDGGSIYHVNGMRCRRRDVIDIFLGTGLGGKNNYAVIQQGAVNRMIEAKPDEMRQVLEEAAGISKYKERRRETENRIRHTRENLDRLNDLIREITQQLARLKRQAGNAEKYKQYKSQERQLRAEVLALRWRALAQQANAHQHKLDAQREAQHSKREHAREVGQRISEHRGEQRRAAQQCQTRQGDYYAAQADLARVEQALEHARELARVQTAELGNLSHQLGELDERIAAESAAVESAKKTIASHTAELETARQRDAAARAELDKAEQAARASQSTWDDLNSGENNPVQREQTERARIGHMEQTLASLEQRLDKRSAERNQLDASSARTQLAEIDDNLKKLSDELDSLRHNEQQAETQVNRLRTDLAGVQRTLNETRQALASSRGRLTSLESLQQAALREDDSQLQQWLETVGWGDTQGVTHAVHVTDGWEQAAEAALGGFLRALAVPALARRLADIPDWPQEGVTLLNADSDNAGDSEPGPDEALSLAGVLQGPPALQRLAQRIFLVEDAWAAHAATPALKNGQMLVTREGLCFGPGWVRAPRAVDPEQGVLQREQTIKTLRTTIESLEQREAHGKQQQTDLQNQLQAAEKQRSEHARQAGELNRHHGQTLAQQQGLQVRLEQTERRMQQLDAEIADLREQQTDTSKQLDVARQALDATIGAARDHVRQRDTLQQQLQALREAVSQARHTRDSSAGTLQNLQVTLATRRSELQASQQRLADLRERRVHLHQQHEQLQQQARQAQQPGEREQQHKADARARCDAAQQALRRAQEHLSKTEAEAEELARTNQAAEQAVNAASEAVQSIRVNFETVNVRRQTVEEQLAEAGHAPQALCDNLSPEADAQEWEQRIEKLERRIQRLGAINLAAIEEYDREKEREVALQEQHADLSEALDTLESAIAKIDRETRSRFRTTFDQVNTLFAQMFPTLFGGGEARLELTEDNLLETGVQVIARPPGKRNASIQMLSGGEKALTAVALVFALFRMNPAPFCMLDEIDAPLDDANVARFCELVRKMSDQVQFIVITHNKVTMELVNQLHGVTMAEPGVSRLVSVDVDRALQMAG